MIEKIMERFFLMFSIILIGIPLIWIYIIILIFCGHKYAHQFNEYILNFKYKDT